MIRLTDYPDMTIVVYHGLKATPTHMSGLGMHENMADTWHTLVLDHSFGYKT